MISVARRSILIVLLALLSLPMLYLASPAPVAAQTNNDAEVLTEYLSQAQSATPAAGPDSGSLAMDGGPNSAHSLGVELADQVIHVDFQTPQVEDGEVWAVALAFRSSGDQFHFFLYWSDGAWSFAPAGGGNVQSGEAVAPGAAGSPVSIDLAAVGPDGYVGINGEFTTTLDLSSQLGAGDVQLSSNLIGTFDPGDDPVSFSNFTVWPISAEAPPSEASPTAQVEASPVAASPTTETEPIPAEASPTTQVEPSTPEPAPASPTTQAVPATVEPAATPQPESAVQIDPSQDDATTFNTLLMTTTTEPIIFGPVDDSLAHDPEFVAYYPTGVTVTDFVARLECLSTISAAEGFWDCGIAFRDTATDNQYVVGYVSDGSWFLSLGLVEPLQQGSDAPVSASAGNKVTLNLIVVGADGYFGINGEFIAKLDLSALPGPGTVDVATAFFNDTSIEDGSLQFEDFMVWSLDAEVVTPEASPTQPVDEPTPTSEAGLTPAASPTTATGASNIVGTTYTSPTFGYSLSWNDSWSVDSEESDETGDYLGLNNGVVLVDLIGEAWDPATGTCFDRLVDFYSSDPAYSNIQSATDNVSANPGIWDITGIMTLTYTDEDDGSTADYINYAACSQIPGQNALVSLEQFVPVAEFRSQVDAMDELRNSFVLNAGTVVVDQTPTPAVEESPTSIVEASPTAIAGQTSNVVGTTYTSPTFGYSLTWDETFEVLLDQSTNGVDYLRISNETVSADLFAAAGDETPTQCIDNLVAFYENDPLYSDITFVTDAQNQPIRTTGDGQATALLSFTVTGDDGVATEQFDDVTCIRLEDQGAILVLEVFTSPSDFVLQSETIAMLKEGLVLPGGTVLEPTAVPQLTPQIQPTVPASDATVVPPPVDEPLSATFLLTPIGDSGVQGTGTVEGQARLVTLTAIVIGATPGDLVAIHRGSCGINLLGEPDYIVGELDENGLLRADVQVRLTVLLTRDTYSVVIYSGGDDFSTPLACGEISA